MASSASKSPSGENTFLIEHVGVEGVVQLPLNFEREISKVIVKDELFDKIKTLRLNENPVTTLKGAEKLVNLEKLFCGRRRSFKAIPRWIEELPNLREINLDGNDIHSLPHNFFHHHLEKVDFSGNKNLKQIPNMGDNLTFLDMRDCDIQSLPHNFFHHHLEKVDLDGAA